MQQSSGASPLVAAAGLLLETSLGSLTIDLTGADCPALSANFLNLCRAQFWDGAVATEVIPEVAIFFSLTADPVHHSLLCAALDRHGGSSSVQSFWSLLPPPPVTASTQSGGVQDVVTQQQRALQQAIQLEIRQCKRRVCVGISPPPTPSVGGTAAAAANAHRPVFVATTAGGPPSPCSVRQSGQLLVDVTAPTLRFGLTLSNRSMDFLDKQYVAIGRVAEGESVLQRMQRAPVRERQANAAGSSSSLSHRVAGQEDVVGGRPASAWPQPLRMLRVKRAVVLPTAGTDKYLPVSSSASLSVLGGTRSAADALRQRQRVGEALHAAGCFNWWASAAAVRAAQGQVAAVVAASLAAEDRTAALGRPKTVAEAERFLRGTPANAASLSSPLIILQDSSALLKRPLSAATSEGPAVSYNPHSTGAFLSSDDDDDEDAAQRERTGQSAKQLEERRRLFMQHHQEKANETLSLMLNVLNGVADTRGDIKPPETVLFVCKLNPVTTGEGLALCFAQFGHVVSADVIADPKTKQSLCYGFVEFESVEACFRAFQKMDRALVDDCRIHVDFSQSVSKLWSQRQREMRKRDRPS